MKFEDYLMEQNDDNERKRLELKSEVNKLEAELVEQQNMNQVLHYALHGPVASYPCFASLVPPEVQGLLAELATVENEITRLEKKVDELKLRLYQERRETKECQMQQQHRKLVVDNYYLPPCIPRNWLDLTNDFCYLPRSQNYEDFAIEKTRLRRASVGSAAEVPGLFYTSSIKSRRSRRHSGKLKSKHEVYKLICNDKPNELSEELVKCLIGIILDLKMEIPDREGSAVITKLSCKNSKGTKTSFNCKPTLLPINQSMTNLDPYRIMPDLDSTIRDIGPYKNFIQITRDSIDISRYSDTLPVTQQLRTLMHKLANVDLTFLTYKQKLAFWINVYNACIMHGFLENGLPSSQEKLLATMSKAAINVGGIVLNALAIEHFILRHPNEQKQGPVDDKEMLLRHAYGLKYPEPNVTFALCRGSCSSPALRVYTPDEVANELERAKVEYLEASVGITSKRKIIVPKLLQWHMQDFADNIESLVEWIYSQLPRSGSLKRLMMECLEGETTSPTKMIEIQPYKYEFRYLLPF